MVCSLQVPESLFQFCQAVGVQQRCCSVAEADASICQLSPKAVELLIQLSDLRVLLQVSLQ